MSKDDLELYKKMLIQEILKMESDFYSEEHINIFTRTIRENTTKIAKYKVGFTFISIKTNIYDGKYNWHKYFIIFPFKQNNTCAYPDLNNSKIIIKDICLNVDESFYKFIHSEMVNKANFLIGKICKANEVKWNLTNERIITIINKNNLHSLKNMLVHSNFEEWYENGKIYISDYIVKVENPYTNLVPFPVKPIFFNINLCDNGYNYLTCQ
jgi:hypothetical protein